MSSSSIIIVWVRTGFEPEPNLNPRFRFKFEWRPEPNPKVRFWVRKNMMENRTEPDFPTTMLAAGEGRFEVAGSGEAGFGVSNLLSCLWHQSQTCRVCFTSACIRKTWKCLVMLSCLDFENKKDKRNKWNFLLIFDLNLIWLNSN